MTRHNLEVMMIPSPSSHPVELVSPDNLTTMTQEPGKLQNRSSLNGAWILDKSRGNPLLRGYLETMNVPELAIVAHEKGEADHPTIHVVELSPSAYKIQKSSRVNDLEEEFVLNKEKIMQGSNGERKKWSIAASQNEGHVCIHTKMQTMNGLAEVVDIKTLVRDETGGGVFMLQELTIHNLTANKSHCTKRYFRPHHIEGELAVAPTARRKHPEDVAEDVDVDVVGIDIVEEEDEDD